MGRDLAYSTAKARRKLGWSPSMTYRDSIERTVRWYLDREGSAPVPAGKSVPVGPGASNSG